jgi:hypothetical protein
MSMMVRFWPTPAPAGHAYWRVFASDNQGDATGILLSEVEFRATAGGADQATGGTAIGSDDATTNEFAKAFDDSGATDWFADSGPTNQWIGYQFASAVDVQEVAITFSATATQTALNRAPKTCSVDYSDDGSSWTTAFSFVVYGHLIADTREYPESAPASGFHRLWRVLGEVTGTTSIQLDEIELRATSGGADQVPVQSGAVGGSTGRTIKSADAGGNEAWRVFDNTTGSWFTSNGSGVNQWVGFVFQDPVKVEEVSIKCASNASRAPTIIRIEYSDDGGSTWTQQKRITGLSWSASETKVLAAI